MGFMFVNQKIVAVNLCQVRSLHLDPCFKLGGEVIKLVREADVLGILLEKLNCIPHIKALKVRSLKSFGCCQSGDQYGLVGYL